MAYATVSDVEAALGRSLTSAEQARALTLVDWAQLIITRRLPNLADRISRDPGLQDVVVMVEAQAVARVLRNPDGMYRESLDDYSYTRAEEVATGRLYITDDEWSLLLTTADDSGSGSEDAFTIRPYGKPGYAHDTWTSTTGHR